MLRMYWDGEERPSVECPLADFFGDPWNEDSYCSLPMGIRSDRNYSYFRMPFERSARIVVESFDPHPAELQYAMVLDQGALPPGSARFHARWRRERDGQSFDYTVLDCKGAPGKFVGMVLSVHNLVGGWWGEGDEKIWVDGEGFPSTYGTGSEDYFGDAWGIRYFTNPYHGCPTFLSPEATRRQSSYRWHVSDAVPFERSLRMTIENYSALGEGPVRNDYSSVAYWYQAPGGSDAFIPVGAEDVEPRLHEIPGLVEAETALALSPSDPALLAREDADPAPSVRIERDEGVAPYEMSGGKGLRIRGPEAFEVPVQFAAPAPGDYTVEVVTADGVPSDPVRLYADGQPLEDRVRFGTDVRGFTLRFGQEKGGGRNEAWIDGFALHPYKNFVREWYVIGPFPNKDDGGFDVAYGPELEPFAAGKSYPGKSGDVRWVRVRTASGVVQGMKILDDQGNLVAYACAVVRSPDARKCTAFLGSDDGAKVWIQGKLVHQNHTHRVVTQDQDRFEVDLVPGANVVLLKVDQGGGPWGFCFRIDDPEGVLEYGLPE
jgi:hypothetical protein